MHFSQKVHDDLKESKVSLKDVVRDVIDYQGALKALFTPFHAI